MVDTTQADRFIKKQSREKVKFMKRKKVRKKFIVIYNKMCPKCKRQAIKNPTLPMTQYCEECQDMMERVYDE